jgi:SAM-dependent methyltransferase
MTAIFREDDMETTAVAAEARIGSPRKEAIRRYWNEHIHDLAVVKHPVGTAGFFRDLDEYRFDKLRYLPRVVDFGAYRGKKLLEIGCGAGIDLVRFARGGADATGVDLSEVAIGLARDNFRLNGLPGRLEVMDGEDLSFADESFDVVYAHGVLQYADDPARIVAEARRVLRPGGEAVFMVYNRFSWLNLMSAVFGVGLEHADAPVLRKYSIGRIREMVLREFPRVRVVVERFPVATRLHGGLKGFLYNKLFVGTFSALPGAWVRPFGWHIMLFAKKGA